MDMVMDGAGKILQWGNGVGPLNGIAPVLMSQALIDALGKLPAVPAGGLHWDGQKLTTTPATAG